MCISELLAQEPEPMVQVHANGPVCESGLSCDLFAAHLLHEAKGQRLPISPAQRTQHVRGAECARGRYGCRVLLRELLRLARSAMVHPCLVARHRRDPTSE